MTYHSKAVALWTQTRNGVCHADKSFYEESGGIFEPPAYFIELIKIATWFKAIFCYMLSVYSLTFGVRIAKTLFTQPGAMKKFSSLL
jgi:hypothetical protein